MARRTKTSAADDVVEIIAMLPWWGGVAMALVFYLVLSAYADTPLPTAVQPGQVGSAMTASMFKGLAHAAKYLLPFLCLVGAVVSAWRRRTRRELVDRLAAAPAAQAIDGMSWNEFEMLVGESFRCRGYRVEETGGGGPDGGVDLLLRKGTETSLVQCKHWKASMVGVDVVRQLYGVMAARGATAGFVVTSGRFSDDAKRFAEGRNVDLIDGLKLQEMLAQAKTLRAKKTAPHVEPRPVATVAGAHPECPRCASPMVRRKAARGEHAGREFWGCVTYPKCRGMRDVAGADTSG